jgi:hypothetical protein
MFVFEIKFVGHCSSVHKKMNAETGSGKKINCNYEREKLWKGYATYRSRINSFMKCPPLVCFCLCWFPLHWLIKHECQEVRPFPLSLEAHVVLPLALQFKFNATGTMQQIESHNISIIDLLKD